MHRNIIVSLLRSGRRDLACVYAHHVTAKRGLFYHGTSTTLAKHILSEGFVPNPRKKIWDGETGVQESYTGTYFTARLSTANRYADGAASKFGGYPVVFEVQLETRTGLFDEDEIAPVAGAVLTQMSEERDLKSLPPTGELMRPCARRAQYLLSKPPRLMGFREAVLMRWIGSGEEDYRQQPFAQLYRKRFGETPIHPQYYEAVASAVKAAVDAFLQDVAETQTTKGGKRYRAANTKLLKVLNLSKYGPHPTGSWTQNIRLVEPVRFRGANKIAAAVVREIDVDYAAKIKTNTYWVLYGKPSKALVTDKDDRYEVHDVVKRGWPKPHRMAASFDDRIDEILRQQTKQRKKRVGIDGDRRVTDEVEVQQTIPGKTWVFWHNAGPNKPTVEVVTINGLRRARALRDVLRKSGLRDFQKLREFAFDWRKKNPR